ncbi:MAG: M61 family metallopeptidase [Mastigocoleus sp.]
MTEATASRFEPETQPASEKIHYYVAMPQPENHLFEVSLHLRNYCAEYLNLKLPVWTPGSYLVREYARHLQNFTAWTGDKCLEWHKVSKNYWQVKIDTSEEVLIRYQIFANELTVRTNHLDATHGYFNGAAIFFRIPELDKQEIYVTVKPPKDDWKIATGLKTVPEQSNTFLAADYDTLVDSPFEIGTHQLHHFQVMEKPHELAIWGQGNYQTQQMIADIKKVIQVEAKIFDGLPYERYLFLLHLSPKASGGLEHKNSTSLIYQRFGFRDRSKYERFMQLVAHEFFHLWNVKRIRPKALEVFDYDQENYTPSLWFCEGTTSYYDLIIPFRAGIYDAKVYLENLSKEITRYETTPGRKVQPVDESSFDAWIKLYRQDANSPNFQISYYLKGELVSLLLDLMIRSRHQNQRSLDDVMVKMWEQFGKEEIGYTPQQLQTVIESVAGIELEDFFNSYVRSTENLPFNKYLEPFGLQLVGNIPEEPYLGLKVKSDAGKDKIKFVETDSPAHRAGIDPGDELLAINGVRVSALQLKDRLGDYQPGDTIQVTVFHQDLLRNYSVTLEQPASTQYSLQPIQNPTPQQQENFIGWLGTSIEDIQ